MVWVESKEKDKEARVRIQEEKLGQSYCGATWASDTDSWKTSWKIVLEMILDNKSP